MDNFSTLLKDYQIKEGNQKLIGNWMKNSLVNQDDRK